MEVFNDGIMHAQKLDDKWLFLCWENNDIGHLPIQLVKDLRKMEQLVVDNRMIGWVCNSEKRHKEFHNILRRVGAEVYDEDDEFLFFKKEIPNVQPN